MNNVNSSNLIDRPNVSYLSFDLEEGISVNGENGENFRYLTENEASGNLVLVNNQLRLETVYQNYNPSISNGYGPYPSFFSTDIAELTNNFYLAKSLLSLQIPRSITFEVPRNAVKQAFPSADLEGSSKALVTFSTGTNEATGKELLAVEDQTKIIRTIQKLETVLQYMATNEFILNIACVNNRFLLLDPANMNSLELLANIQRLAPLNFNSINVVPKNLDPKNIKAIEGVLNLSLDKLSTMDLAAIVRIPKGATLIGLLNHRAKH